ncbi:adhesion G protein-coupled receptor L4-like isoform X2 [Mizuhopecten yessoensis]|uniref:adhesion G protein-coupled receptor L4-like isoform X2 n=1 Tax=Mizuhopecten yessoensis TaxID=6573 RepID=UPI000B45E537|nr:adhesion G protein-coupled receptor L4-like isoform X2 [Mizuhopecten yessoensis]
MSKASPEEDGNLKMTCEFDAKGSCGNIEWRIRDYSASKNTSKITITHRDDGFRKQSEITIHSLTPRDAGKVYCGLGGQNMVFNVTVQPLPILKIFPLSTAVEEGNNATIVCKISNWLEINWSNWTITLFHDGSPLLSETNVSELQLPFPTIKSSDGGYYLCKLCRKNPHEKCLTQTSSLIVDTKAVIRCPAELINGIIWEATPANYSSTNNCPSGYLGTANRLCNGDGRWDSVNMFECVREEILLATNEINDLNQFGGTTEEKGKQIGYALDIIANMTLPGDNKQMTAGDLHNTTAVLNHMVELITSDENTVRVNKTKFVGIISDMLSESNKASWTKVNDNSKNTDLPSGATSLLMTVERFGSAVAKNLTSRNAKINIITPNIIIKIEKPSSSNIEFKPENSSPGSGHGISLNLHDFDDITFTAALYKTMGFLLQNKNGSDGVQQYTSEVLSLSINGRETNHLKTPVMLTFDTVNLTRDHNLTNNIKKRCVFWNETQGWLSQGCSWVNHSCQCTHLTNFAVLISPIEVSDAYVLRIISFVGCILSVLSTVTTMVVYLKLWRYLKSDRSRLLLNLCAALTTSYVLFLVGIDKTQNNTLCTTIAALLHYFLLSTFCLMLAEGIQLFISVTSVFHVKSKLRWLLLLGWGVPLVVVGVTVGMKYNNEYHSEDYCWLTLSNGVLYSFVGPAVGVILVNIIIIFCVMKALYSSQFIRTKTEKQKIATGVRSVTVLLPVLGVTWLFGVISVNDDLIVFQYLFAVTNSLQGFFIFLFYCIFNVPVRRALEKKIKRFEYRTQSSKIGSKLQVMNTKSTDSGKTKDEDRPQQQFHNPVFRYPRPYIDHNIEDPQYNVQTNRSLCLSSPYDTSAVGNRYNYRPRTYMLS